MAVLIAYLLLGAISMVTGQEYRASISGDVTDASGSPVPGAQVIVTSVERRITYSAVTNNAGRYQTQFLPPGPYFIEIEKDGFRKVRRDGINLSSADRARIDIRLEVGAVAESVTVSEQIPLLQTESASRTGTIERKLLEDIPANGRNLFQFQYTLPGITKASNYWGTYELYAFGNINAVSINGGRVGENETLLDGIASTRGSRSASFAPALNAISEVNILTNSYDASFGRMGGGVTSITLKTGTNTLHGQAFEFNKNEALRSNGWSRNAAGIRRPRYRNNTFGFTVDGPVYIPKLFDGRNRLFFMVSLEGLREGNPQTQLWTVPTAQQLQGDFSGTVNNAQRLVTIYDPATVQQNPNGTYSRQPFAGNRIPANRINPVAAKAAGFYPAPNRVSEAADGQNNYLFVNKSENSYDQWLGKMDWNVSSRSRLNWRYGETPWYNFARIQWGTNAAEPSGEYPSTRISRNWGADWTYTLSPSAVFNLRGGLARYEGFSGNTISAGFNPAELGFPQGLVSQFTALQYPRFNLTGGLNFSPLGATVTRSYETQDNYSIQPNLTLIHGRHSLKTGGELRRYHDNRLQPGSAAGNYSFGRNWTQANPQQADALSGVDFATFLLGIPTSGFVDRNMDPAYRYKYYVLFLQDDWKITPRLSLNLGIRWDYEAPIRERYNRQVRGFAFDQPAAISATGLDLRGGLLYAGSAGTDSQAFNRDLNNIQPRIGVAYQLTSKWVLRGGYGLYYLGQNAAGPNTGFSRPTPLIASTDNNIRPSVTLSDPFPASLFPSGLLQPIGSSQGLATNLGLAVTAQYLERPLPYSQQYSFGIQRQLFNSWLIDASYVGNKTSSLPVNLPQNFIPADTLNSLAVAARPAFFNAAVPNPFAGRLPGTGLNGANIPRQQTLVRYPHFSQVTITNVPIGSQRYDSLQMKATRRFAGGFTAQVSYTWAKTLEQVSTLNPQAVNLSDLRNTGLEKRLQQWDIPHTLVAVTTVELPFGKGKAFLNNLNGVGQALLGGWNLNTQFMIRSGVPFDFPNASPLAARSARLTEQQRDERARAAGRDEFNPFFDKYYDTTLFPAAAQAPFTLRDFPTRFPDVRSRYLTSWEISGYKEFLVKERLRIQIRADMQNAFQYAYFGAQATNNVADPRFGQLNPAQNNDVRQVVLVLKLLW